MKVRVTVTLSIQLRNLLKGKLRSYFLGAEKRGENKRRKNERKTAVSRADLTLERS